MRGRLLVCGVLLVTILLTIALGGSAARPAEPHAEAAPVAVCSPRASGYSCLAGPVD